MTLGVDLGRAGVKVVACDAGGGARGAERAIDPTLVDAARREALIAALREAAGELGARPGAALHLAVPRALGIVKRLDLPPAEDAELEAMIRLQAARELPFALEETVLAWAREAPDKASPAAAARVVFAAVRRDTIEELRAVVAAAGFRPANIEVSTKAAARTLVLEGPRQDDDEEVLLVEVGHATSDVIVTRGGRLVYTRSASVGSGRAEGRDDEAWLRRLEQEVVRSLVAARTRVGDTEDDGSARAGPPDALLLAGGGAALEALRESLAARVGREPSILRGVPLPEGDGDEARGARFVVARGLADPRPTPGIPRLDLAHQAKSRAARGARQRLVAGAVAAAALVLGSGLAVERAFADAAAEVERLTTQRADLAPAVERASVTRAELEQAQAWTARKGRELELLLAVATALPEDDRAYLTQLRWVEERAVRLAGRAKDWSAAAALFSRLEADPRFVRATPDSIRRPREASAIGVEFSGQAQPAEARP